jgi:hypothetical protein
MEDHMPAPSSAIGTVPGVNPQTPGAGNEPLF